MPSPSSPSLSSFSSTATDDISSPPIREIPGDYGPCFIGPIKDRLDYFYNQGTQEFFKSRMVKYQSTIFRANMPPGPFISPNSKVIVLLDAISFPVLFDLSKVNKKDVLDGTYMPSTSFTGGYRTCAYLNPSEPNHSKLKRLFLSLLTSRHHRFIPEFRHSMANLCHALEHELSMNNNKGTANFNDLSDNMSFDFMFRLLFNKKPTDTSIGSKGPKHVTKWLFFQLAPLMSLGLLPKFLGFVEDLLLHTFPFPWFPVKSDYKKLYDAVYSSSTSTLEEAERLGIERDEACHNLVFLAFFNGFGGMKAWFPILMKWVGLGGRELHRQLSNEIRTIVKAEGVSFGALEKMKLTKSVVYEALRMEPPIPYQYATAKKHLVIQNHESSFEVKEGEMLFGYQPFATKDPKIFDNAEEFVGDRFVGEEGEKLLKYVFWSNGRETEEPTEENKQCPAKDLVVLSSRLMVTEFFLRYDTFTVEIGPTPLTAPSVKFTSLTKAGP